MGSAAVAVVMSSTRLGIAAKLLPIVGHRMFEGEDPLATIYTMLTGFASAMTGLWSSVVTWLLASGHELALIGVLAWLFVMGVNGLRRLITGV